MPCALCATWIHTATVVYSVEPIMSNPTENDRVVVGDVNRRRIQVRGGSPADSAGGGGASVPSFRLLTMSGEQGCEVVSLDFPTVAEQLGVRASRVRLLDKTIVHVEPELLVWRLCEMEDPPTKFVAMSESGNFFVCEACRDAGAWHDDYQNWNFEGYESTDSEGM